MGPKDIFIAEITLWYKIFLDSESSLQLVHDVFIYLPKSKCLLLIVMRILRTKSTIKITSNLKILTLSLECS